MWKPICKYDPYFFYKFTNYKWKYTELLLLKLFKNNVGH